MRKNRVRPLLLDVSRLVWRHWIGNRATGIDRVCLAWLERYRRDALAVVQYPRFRRILPAQASDALFELFSESSSLFKKRLLLSGVRHARSLVDSEAGRGRLYLNPGHTGLDKPGFQQWIAKEGLRPIHMIHDLIPITHPEYCRPGEADRHTKRMDAALKTASGFIFNSADTHEAMARFAGERHSPMPPSRIAWLGSELDGHSASISAAQTNPPTFIILGTIEGRKNHALLLNVWSHLIATATGPVPKLLIVGQRGWQCEDVFHRLDQDALLKGHVQELSTCNDDELARHLNSATALLFPSHVEGFGMPLVEALAKGTPVIASDLKVFREIVGDVPDYAAPNDTNGWIKLIQDYATPASSARAAQCRRLDALQLPRWDQHFEQVDSLIAQLS